MANRYHIMGIPMGYPQPESDFGCQNFSYETAHACLTCGRGLIQKDEFRFRAEVTKKRNQILGMHWVFDQLFVKQQVKTIFEIENITGLEYSQPVFHKTGMPIEGIDQLRINTVISEGLITTNLNTETCAMLQNESTIKFLTASKSRLVKGPFCGALKYNFPQGDNCIKIKSESFQNLPDFVRLNYYFGSGSSANQTIIVSNKVKQIIDREKWKGLFLKMVELC